MLGAICCISFLGEKIECDRPLHMCLCVLHSAGALRGTELQSAGGATGVVDASCPQTTDFESKV
jgi:hypothetical protein